ncbi:MAG: DUF389 domain-containing protein [Symploca sp. SIO2G7]|nr:DUF389 domain-containing protein [Symploca sp. SIO2G7]
MQRLTATIRKFLPEPPTAEQEQRLYQDLVQDASWNTNYVALTLSSCIIATLGLISNSTAVIIGAMLVAPLMLPLRGLAFGALEGEVNLFRQSLLAIAGATLIAVCLSCLLGLVTGIPEFGSEVQARIRPNLVDLGIAITAGAISGFAKIRPGISDALAGTAIAVALMPPLCVVGLCLSQGIWLSAVGALVLYLTNLLGITLACMVLFISAGYTQFNRALVWTIALSFPLVLLLGLSFWELVRNVRLEAAIKQKLITETITIGQQGKLLDTKVNWGTNPPQVYLSVWTDQKITPKQVELLQEFLSRKIKQPLTLIILISEVKQVTAGDEENLDKSVPPLLDAPIQPLEPPSPKD